GYFLTGPKKDGNIRDYATVEQLVVLASLESQNALLIEQQKSQGERLTILNTLAIKQMRALIDNPSVKQLKGGALLE
ncbi:MAG: KilA-N domain-containing protein, partial [Candidatus Competibacteraceae bacterium]|nr:KilA-N domain-containing protein [Candidatus Competibacteraceae bacterium]